MVPYHHLHIPCAGLAVGQQIAIMELESIQRYLGNQRFNFLDSTPLLGSDQVEEVLVGDRWIVIVSASAHLRIHNIRLATYSSDTLNHKSKVENGCKAVCNRSRTDPRPNCQARQCCNTPHTRYLLTYRRSSRLLLLRRCGVLLVPRPS